MEGLHESCKETLNLGVLDGGEVVTIEDWKAGSRCDVLEIGNRRYLHSTALGKVLLASLPEKDALRIVKSRGMPRVHRQHDHDLESAGGRARKSSHAGLCRR